MKTRNGFVSNSSASSFMCDVCGGIEAGMDLCMNEVEMFRCEEGHTMHIGCVKNMTDELKDAIAENKYEAISEHCPFCNLDMITDSTALKYLLGKTEMTKEMVLEDIKKNYKTLKDFEE